MEIAENVKRNRNITTFEFFKGNRVAIATKDRADDYYRWRLYVNGDIATLTHGKAKTERGMRKQVSAALNR